MRYLPPATQRRAGSGRWRTRACRVVYCRLPSVAFTTKMLKYAGRKASGATSGTEQCPRRHSSLLPAGTRSERAVWQRRVGRKRRVMSCQNAPLCVPCFSVKATRQYGEGSSVCSNISLYTAGVLARDAATPHCRWRVRRSSRHRQEHAVQESARHADMPATGALCLLAAHGALRGVRGKRARRIARAARMASNARRAAEESARRHHVLAR